MIGWPRLLLLHSAEDRASATISVLGAHAARMSNSQVGLEAAVRGNMPEGRLRIRSRPANPSSFGCKLQIVTLT